MSYRRSELSTPSVNPSPIDPPRPPRSGFSVGVNRQGCVVHLSLTAGDEYGAVELYEHFVQSLAKGRLRLEIG